MTATTGVPLPPLPTFIIIGAQKSATRWLRINLGRHPEIFTASQEVKYFNHPKRCTVLGPQWYRMQFTGWEGEPITGEATPGYMMWRHGPEAVARRISETVPEVRLVAVLRDPVERASSALLHHMKRGRVRPGTRLVELVRAQPPEQDWMGIVTGGWYAASLEPYLRLFGERLLVLLHDDIRADPQREYVRASEFVGTSQRVVPPGLDEVIWSNRPGAAADALVTADDRVELFEHFRADVERLERMLGRDLSVWEPRLNASRTAADGV